MRLPAMPEESSPETAPELSFWWALLSNRGQRGRAAILGILARHAVLLTGVLFLHWSARKFLLMAMINFAWNWALLGVWSYGTCALNTAARDATPVTVTRWVSLAAFGAVVFVTVAWGIGFPVYYLEPGPLVLDRIWWVGLAITIIGPVPGVVEQIRAGVAARLPEERVDAIAEQRRRLLWVGVAPIVGAYGLLMNFPHPPVLTLVVIAYVLFSALLEFRPDLAEQLAKELPR